ncbi:DUF1887 family protein [Caminibacter mediatlanticus TB-2]|uniref:DUF1887 family protein n=1 Tax=Caminibacter mediatlanticus TB-2 TaxID=391592 RepID=A0ABX5VAW1_9BACT|nr:DUF1887 family CARF protein [Caminibacter mediatlanticus]QCT95326.1 DUF1887 family protein [Caminibacter mediatlanticus TB-2]
MTLVNIIGNFITSVAPVFFHFKEKISEHIIISDKKEIKKAQKFAKNIESFCNEFGYEIKNRIVLIEEDSYKEIKNFENELINKKDVYINTTDGLSFINTILSYELLDKFNFISYDIFENELIITGNKKIKKYKCKNMDIKEHLILKGIDKFTFALSHKYDKKLLKELFYNTDFSDFVVYLGQNKSFPKGFKKIKKILKQLNITLDFNKSYKVITGDLFEYFVFEYLSERNYFDDIKISVKVSENGIKNEFDILAIKNNHLYIIECKNKKINKILDSLIYKYIALRKNLDYDSKAFIISLDTKFLENLELRANLNNVFLISFKKLNKIGGIL